MRIKNSFAISSLDETFNLSISERDVLISPASDTTLMVYLNKKALQNLWTHDCSI